jgi:hypothetical protein
VVSGSAGTMRLARLNDIQMVVGIAQLIGATQKAVERSHGSATVAKSSVEAW